MSVCGNVYMKAGVHGCSLRSPETGTTASCEPPNMSAEKRIQVFWKSNKWTVSPANSSFFLVMFFQVPYKEMSFTMAFAFIWFLPLTKFLLTPLTCPAPAKPPSTNCLLLSCYMYSIILFWLFPSAHLLRSLYISTLTHIHICMT